VPLSHLEAIIAKRGGTIGYDAVAFPALDANSACRTPRLHAYLNRRGFAVPVERFQAGAASHAAAVAATAIGVAGGDSGPQKGCATRKASTMSGRRSDLSAHALRDQSAPKPQAPCPVPVEREKAQVRDVAGASIHHCDAHSNWPNLSSERKGGALAISLEKPFNKQPEEFTLPGH